MRDRAELPLSFLTFLSPFEDLPFSYFKNYYCLVIFACWRTVMVDFYCRVICIGNSMICSDISKLLYEISRAVRRVKFETILKCHKWYLCQISSANHAIICLYDYPQKVCNFHM